MPGRCWTYHITKQTMAIINYCCRINQYDTCKIVIGNLGLGYEVIHKRKSWLQSGPTPSQILSSSGIHEGAR